MIKAPALSAENRYVKSVKLNGKPLQDMTITHAEIMNGGVMEFEMVAKEAVAK